MVGAELFLTIYLSYPWEGGASCAQISANVDKKI